MHMLATSARPEHTGQHEVSSRRCVQSGCIHLEKIGMVRAIPCQSVQCYQRFFCVGPTADAVARLGACFFLLGSNGLETLGNLLRHGPARSFSWCVCPIPAVGPPGSAPSASSSLGPDCLAPHLQPSAKHRWQNLLPRRLKKKYADLADAERRPTKPNELHFDTTRGWQRAAKL